jgi:hypothetical protein
MDQHKTDALLALWCAVDELTHVATPTDMDQLIADLEQQARVVCSTLDERVRIITQRAILQALRDQSFYWSIIA